MQDQRLEGSAVYAIAVIEHPAFLIGVPEILQSGDFWFLDRSVPSEEKEKLVFVIEINGLGPDQRSALLQNF